MPDSTPLSTATTFSKTAAVVLLLCLAGIVWHAKMQNLDLHTAYKGEAVEDYVSLKLHPENFVKNWYTSQADLIHNSWAMRPYLFLAQNFDIPPAMSIPPILLAQITLFIFALFHFGLAFYENVQKTLLFVAICFTAPATSLDLARFSYGITSNISPLYYGWAYAFLILGLSFHIRDKYILAFITLTLGSLCHITLGLYFWIFICCYFACTPRMLLRRDVLTGLALSLPTLGLYAFDIIHKNEVVRKIPDDLWLATTKIFSFHWYPSSVGIFTRNAYNRLLPLIIMAILVCFALHKLQPTTEKERKSLYGMAGTIIIGVAGYIAAEIIQSPFIIKLCPLRSTTLLSFFLSAYITGYLYEQITSGSASNIIAAAWMLAAMTVVHPGIPLAPALLLLYNEVRTFKSKKRRTLGMLLLAGITTAAIIVITANIMATSSNAEYRSVGTFVQSFFWAPLYRFHPGKVIDMTLLGGRMDAYLPPLSLIIFTTWITIAAYIYTKQSHAPIKWTIGLCACATILTSVWLDCNLPAKQWVKKNGEIAQAYLDAQIWAKNNTSTQSLFMIEPYRGEGWRGLSQRSSFGNIHSWGYAAISYLPDMERFKEGQRRMAAFGIDWTRQFPDGTYEKGMAAKPLKRQLRDRLYSMTRNELLNLAEEFNIDYIVMDKKYIKEKISLPIAYKNSRLIIFDTHSPKHSTQHSS